MSDVRYHHAARLKKRFFAGGKSQTVAFERLSQIVERYVAKAKEGGERSGAMRRAFGDELVRMKGRFTARDGVPPSQIYRTPEVWVRVICNLAGEVGENPDIALIKALDEALATKDEAAAAQPMHWVDELSTLVALMGEKLREEADLVGLADYVARSGLLVEDGKIIVNQWPMSTIGFVEGDLYNPWVLDLVPHVWGLNFRPVDKGSELDVSSMDEEWKQLLDELTANDPKAREKAVVVTTFAGVRTGACFTVDEERGEPAFAFLEWHHAEMSLVDAAGEVIATVPTTAEFGDMREEIAGMYTPGTDDRSEAVGKPSNWMPGSVRFHFAGSNGFTRIAQSLIVRPWNFTDRLEDDFWAPDPQDDADTPVTAPRHTVAAAIEGNLLHADDAGRGDLRLDRLLAREIGRISRSVEKFRRANDNMRAVRREALLADWKREVE